MTPVFGEFLVLAGQQIAAATLPRGELPGDARDEIIGELDRLVTAPARPAGGRADEIRAAASATRGPDVTSRPRQAPGGRRGASRGEQMAASSRLPGRGRHATARLA